MRTAMLIAGAALVAMAGLSAPAKAQPAASGPPDWPCVQRLIPELSAGSIWTGPSIDDLDEEWWSDDEVGSVARFATARENSQAAAVERVREFASEVDGDEERLTLLFAGLFERISRERTRTIEAILRYTGGQEDRLATISELVDRLEEARNDDTDAEGVAELEQQVHWERRVFEDRQDSLRALCEQPYRLEERLSRLVRAMEAEM